jgi:menaquinone-dependent protoporphyrinogen oxidase
MKVLVAVASRYGATRGIADAIGRTLEAGGLEVVVKPVEAAPPPAKFDAVVLGSAVYAGHWVKSAREYASDHSTSLRSKPLWMFSSGPVGDPLKPIEEESVSVSDLEADLRPVEHKVFPGALFKHQLHFGDRAIAAAFKVAEGDYRDWDEISAWAGSIANQLSVGAG